MSKGERLVKLMTNAENSELSLLESEKKMLADYLIANGVIVPYMDFYTTKEEAEQAL